MPKTAANLLLDVARFQLDSKLAGGEELAQTPSKLKPFESSRHYFGAEVRAWRMLRGYSLARLGSVVHVSGDLLGKIEKAQRRPTPDLIERCDHALAADGTLIRLYELAYGTCPADTQTGAPPDFRQPINGSRHAPSEQSTLIGFEHVPDVANLAAYRHRRPVLIG